MVKKEAKIETSTVLYRKYRPEHFDQVIGQDHVISVLKQSLESGKVGHAYLFAGTRGTGKTSVARIFARELGTSTNDLYEIDAASNNKVEDVHELRESVRTLPFDSTYKVYILDEVHMLSKGAFNALLKTLEEPPKHVIFILATTELEKVPDTIVSRCQVFTFKKPSDVMLRDIVVDIAKQEGVSIDQSGAELIALLGDGSFRDTEGILDKVLSFVSKKKVTIEDIEAVTGAPSRALVYAYLSALCTRDMAAGFSALQQAEKQNADMRLFTKLVIHLFRIALVLRVAPTYTDLTSELSDTDQTHLEKLVTQHKEMITSRNLELLLEAYQRMRQTFIQTLPLELALILIVNNDSVVQEK